MKRRVSALCAVLLLASGLPATALAQYKWVDDAGQVVYSDRPPASARSGVQLMRGSVAVPAPLGAAPVARTGPSDATSSPADPAAADKPADKPAAERAAADKAGADKDAKSGKDGAKDPAAAPKTFAERDMAFKRRQQEREQAERKQAEQAQKAAQLARICEDRRTDLRTLDSGARISRVDASGERSFMSEEELAKRRDTLQKALNEDCRRG
ncbi:MAG: DUF4124 domain-containing protein [Burkholderiaceae bacterium]|nr:DUF4124 domain-containing protein [Burkholderiaceae bacterium]